MANNCRVFTPDDYVNELLDIAEYEHDLFGSRVLENSCGDGNVLKEIVRRYIEDSLDRGYTLSDIKRGLESDIWGVEIEQKSVDICRKNLDKEAEKFNIRNVNWKILCGDYLKLKLNEKFLYIIGNPPYIVYRDIHIEERNYLKKHFVSCAEGKFDYYYAFIEKSIHDMEENGHLAYIVPDSIYKNVFARSLRGLMEPYLSEIHDYTSQNKFPGTTISSTVLLLRKQQTAEFLYRDMIQSKQIRMRKNVLGEKWVFSDDFGAEKRHRFGDWFQVSNTVATLCNDAFLLENYVVDNGYYILPDGDQIEAEIVQPALSRKRRNKKCAIIFPYWYENGVLRHYSEEEFTNMYPFAASHLKKYENRLSDRAADKNALWFEYGRSQALHRIQYKKAVIPSILTNHIHVTIAEEYVIPCAGFMITERGNHTLPEAKELLESREFYGYLREIGIFTTGKSRRLTVKDIENYSFD